MNYSTENIKIVKFVDLMGNNSSFSIDYLVFYCATLKQVDDLKKYCSTTLGDFK